jgi:hypothetical protein
MRKLIILFAALLAIGFAQTVEKVENELVQTDRVIENVRPKVEESGNERAQNVLNNAVQSQTSAWDAFREQALRRALGLTLTARAQAKQAFALVELNPDRVQAELERTGDVLTELGPQVGRSEEPKVRELWRMAQSEQATARQEFDRQHLRLALKFTFAARLHAWAAFKLVRRNADPEKLKAELDRTYDLLERVKEPVEASGNERARQLLQKAGNWQEQARTAYGNRLWGQTLKFTLAARDLALRAWELARGSTTLPLVERALGETDQLLDAWSDELRQSDQDQVRTLLEQAIDQQARARQSFNDRDLKTALQATTLARKFLNRALEAVNSDQ